MPLVFGRTRGTSALRIKSTTARSSFERRHADVSAARHHSQPGLAHRRDPLPSLPEGVRDPDRPILEKSAAEETKQREILLGQGEAERKKLVLNADGALAQKLDALIKVNEQWAKAYSQRQVPSLVMGGGVDGADKSTTDFAQMMQLLVANEMGLDLRIPKK